MAQAACCPVPVCCRGASLAHPCMLCEQRLPGSAACNAAARQQPTGRQRGSSPHQALIWRPVPQGRVRGAPPQSREEARRERGAAAGAAGGGGAAAGGEARSGGRPAAHPQAAARRRRAAAPWPGCRGRGQPAQAAASSGAACRTVGEREAAEEARNGQGIGQRRRWEQGPGCGAPHHHSTSRASSSGRRRRRRQQTACSQRLGCSTAAAGCGPQRCCAASVAASSKQWGRQAEQPVEHAALCASQGIAGAQRRERHRQRCSSSRAPAAASRHAATVLCCTSRGRSGCRKGAAHAEQQAARAIRAGLALHSEKKPLCSSFPPAVTHAAAAAAVGTVASLSPCGTWALPAAMQCTAALAAAAAAS